MVAGGSGGGSGNTLYESAGNYSAAGGLIGYDGGYYSGHSYSNQMVKEQHKHQVVKLAIIIFQQLV